jgi:regulator of replication initiation timing
MKKTSKDIKTIGKYVTELYKGIEEREKILASVLKENEQLKLQNEQNQCKI